MPTQFYRGDGNNEHLPQLLDRNDLQLMLFVATLEDNEALLKELHTRYNIDLNLFYRGTPLDYAVKYQRHHALKYLLYNRAKFGKYGNIRQTAIYAALHNRDYVAIDLLNHYNRLEMIESVEFIELFNSNPDKFLLSCVLKRLSITKRNGIFFAFIAQSNEDGVGFMLSCGFNINTKDQHGQHALQLAVQNNDKDMVRALLRYRDKISKQHLTKALEVAKAGRCQESLDIIQSAIITENLVRDRRLYNYTQVLDNPSRLCPQEFATEKESLLCGLRRRFEEEQMNKNIPSCRSCSQ